MDNREGRFLPVDPRTQGGLVDPGGERRVMEGFRLVEVLLTGGAPWGFTLKGGKEHGEPLIITKVEDGNKSADILMAGDEIVNINDQPLLGYRQEAICLVKGSHKTLKMIVKRRNDVAYRPHSWHTNKFTESTVDTVTENSNSNASPFWNPRYRSSSSSHELLSSSWDQPNLQRNSNHFSSMGSMDSIDQTYQFGRLSSSKSNNSIDFLGSQNKADSAYGSFSASFNTPDHTLSKTGSASTENILYKTNELDNKKAAYGKASPCLNDARHATEKSGFQSSSVYDTNKAHRTEDYGESRHSIRSNIGPIWHIPDKKKTSSPPPPPPPVRSDSYGVTKSHDKPAGLMHLDMSSTQHFATRSCGNSDYNPETIANQQKAFGPNVMATADIRRISNSPYHVDFNVDHGLPLSKEKYVDSPNGSKLQASWSTSDVRFAQPAYTYQHHRQYSDESTLFQNTRVSALNKPQQPITYETGFSEMPAVSANVYHHNQFKVPTPSFSGVKQNVENNGQNYFYNVSPKQPQAITTQYHFKEESCAPEVSCNRNQAQPENTAINIQPSNYYLPPEYNQSSPVNCETKIIKVSEKRDGYLDNNEKIINTNSGYLEAQNNNKYNQMEHLKIITYKSSPSYSWGRDENKITPQVTPMLHSLAQEGKNQSECFLDPGNEKQAFADVSKQSRRSDRFATTLRNEIQQRRARLQKSKSTAALTETNDLENCQNWNQDSLESMSPPSDVSFSSTYRSHLQEAQARVLRATSFKRRDLEPGITEHIPLSQDCGVLSLKSMSVFSPDIPCLPIDHVQPKKNVVASSSQNISRIGGRKRFSSQQKLMSYSEPEKINEVGVCIDRYNFHNGKSSNGSVKSFVDRCKFFEETSKCPKPKVPPKHSPTYQAEINQPANESASNKYPAEEIIVHDKRNRAVSLGPENLSEENRTFETSFVDKVTTEQCQRLGTFAEYEASWKEQKKSLERKNSGRCHSADNILDAGIEQSSKSQYIHERSRSSPTTDFHAKAAIVHSKRQADSARKDSENSNLTHCHSRTGDSSIRIVEVGNTIGLSQGKENTSCNKWNQLGTSSQLTETSNVSHQSRARSGTLPNDYRFANENVKQGNNSFSAFPICETDTEVRSYSHVKDRDQWPDHSSMLKKRGTAPQRPPPPKLENRYWRQNSSASSLATSSDSLLTVQSKSAQSYSPCSLGTTTPESTQIQSPSTSPEKHPSFHLHDYPSSVSADNDCSHLESKHFDTETSTKSHYLQIPEMEPSRSPSPQFAPQKLTDKPPLLSPENILRTERVIDNTKVKIVPVKIVHSESHAEKEGRQNLVNAIEPAALLVGHARDHLKTLSTSEQSYSLFCAYTRLEPDLEEADELLSHQYTEDLQGNNVSFLTNLNPKIKDIVYADLKSDELVREIVDKDKSLAEILDPNAKMRTTMDLMEGIFPKDEHLLEEAQHRRKHLPKVPSPRSADTKIDDQSVPSAISLTTSSTYYSTSAAKAELLIKMKDMQEQQNIAESSDDELDNDLSEKKQELIDSITKKLQVLKEAKESLLEDIQCNNSLGEEVDANVNKVCKPNEFDKFRMFIGDLEKIVNLLLSLSGRLARVENALNNLDETVSPEERRTLVAKRKLLTRQHEDAKELKENLDRRERTVYDILAKNLSEENLADYEHFVKMKSALILEQRELEDKIKLGEEQLKCLTESLPSDHIK
ncbi:hypothetical protein GDO86_002991 [Hymenochirus boettgeri]|uniref:Protein Shroom2 n=1 Tax=Hymenochirus boettgeri TaxID=247094 RepID=A0A8T2K2D2_9PIPI|nr:hypothetical protein GDO86_002991 [Hymenochirus boettgeri]